jgi:hypothetical protein
MKKRYVLPLAALLIGIGYIIGTYREAIYKKSLTTTMIPKGKSSYSAPDSLKATADLDDVNLGEMSGILVPERDYFVKKGKRYLTEIVRHPPGKLTVTITPLDENLYVKTP